MLAKIILYRDNGDVINETFFDPLHDQDPSGIGFRWYAGRGELIIDEEAGLAFRSIYIQADLRTAPARTPRRPDPPPPPPQDTHVSVDRYLDLGEIPPADMPDHWDR